MSTARASKQVVLVVEDDAMLREALVDTLLHLGYHVYEAEDGTAALNVVAVVQERIDLVISDYVMPGMDALELYEALKQAGYTGKFLIMTGYPFPKSGQAEEGVTWVSKPIGVGRLRRLLGRIFAQ